MTFVEASFNMQVGGLREIQDFLDAHYLNLSLDRHIETYKAEQAEYRDNVNDESIQVPVHPEEIMYDKGLLKNEYVIKGGHSSVSDSVNNLYARYEEEDAKFRKRLERQSVLPFIMFLADQQLKKFEEQRTLKPLSEELKYAWRKLPFSVKKIAIKAAKSKAVVMINKLPSFHPDKIIPRIEPPKLY